VSSSRAAALPLPFEEDDDEEGPSLTDARPVFLLNLRYGVGREGGARVGSGLRQISEWDRKES
jgi:hypothetical protein